jgi:hypothetical protein
MTVYGVHDKGEDMIKILFRGIDVLIGTPNKLSDVYYGWF